MGRAKIKEELNHSLLFCYPFSSIKVTVISVIVQINSRLSISMSLGWDECKWWKEKSFEINIQLLRKTTEEESLEES